MSRSLVDGANCPTVRPTRGAGRASILQADRAHAMVFTVADEQRVAVARDADAVGTVERAILLAGTGEHSDRASFRLDPADGVRFGVGEVDRPARGNGDALRAGERCVFGRAVIAGKAFFAGAGDVVDGAVLRRDAPD